MMILEKGREKFYTASLLTFHPSFHQHSKGRRNMIVGMGMVRDTKCSEEPGSNNVPSAIVIFSFLVFYFLWFLDNQNTFYFIVGWQRILMPFLALPSQFLCCVCSQTLKSASFPECLTNICWGLIKITMRLWVGAEVSERQLLLVADCRLTPQM